MLSKIKQKIKTRFTKIEYRVEKIPVIRGQQLQDKVALITGGSNGIGYGIAQSFIHNGAKVIITGRDENKLQKVCSNLGKNCRYLVWDASNIKIIQENLEKAIDIFGNIDILVNNAGYHGNQDFFSISENDFDDTFDVNIKNVFFMCQAIGKYFIDNRIQGHILKISSASSAKPAWSPYEISKWACSGFTKGLARELIPYGIVVNGIAPGPTATSMSHWKEGDSLNWPSLPKGRLGLVEEIGNLAVYLCSDSGNFIIGEIVFCDGGSGTITVNK